MLAVSSERFFISSRATGTGDDIGSTEDSDLMASVQKLIVGILILSGNGADAVETAWTELVVTGMNWRDIRLSVETNVHRAAINALNLR